MEDLSGFCIQGDPKCAQLRAYKDEDVTFMTMRSLSNIIAAYGRCGPSNYKQSQY